MFAEKSDRKISHKRRVRHTKVTHTSLIPGLLGSFEEVADRPIDCAN